MSLRIRLFLGCALVAAVAVAAAGFVALQRVDREFSEFVERGDRAGLERLHAGLEERIARDGRAAAARWLARAAAAERGTTVWLDPTGALVATSDPALLRARFTREGEGTLRLNVVRRENGIEQSRFFQWTGLPNLHVEAAGESLGTLYALPRLAPAGPRDPAALVSGEALFRGGVARGLWLAIACGLLVAFVVSFVLGRALARPLEELTAAVRAVSAGDRTRRVPVRGTDEVAVLATSFNALVAGLDRGERLRQSLVTDVAHELRTPVTNLRGQIEALEDGLTAPTPAAIASLEEEIVLLSRLIDDLQDVVLAESGALRLARRPVAVAPAADLALAAIAPRAAAQGITLSSRVPDLPPVDADPARLAQIFRALLENALTHTPAGGTIAIAAERVDAASVAISVCDSGRGIAPGDLENVFERFYRADPSRDRATGGAGLGLAVVRRLVEAHGGSITAESTPGTGSAFRFTLPCAPASSS